VAIKAVSSAYVAILTGFVVGKLAVEVVYSTGPKALSCGTPASAV